MNQRFDEARRKVKLLREILDSYPPAPNETQQKNVRILCDSFDVRDQYISSKLGPLKSRFENYLSYKKWASHPQGHAGLKVEILGLIRRISDQVEFLSGEHTNKTPPT